MRVVSMTAYYGNRENMLVKMFGQAVITLSNQLQNPQETVKLNNAWQVVEAAIQSNVEDFEELLEYKTLVAFIKKNKLRGGLPDWEIRN